mgnify:CR=1 FL=1
MPINEWKSTIKVGPVTRGGFLEPFPLSGLGFKSCAWQLGVKKTGGGWQVKKHENHCKVIIIINKNLITVNCMAIIYKFVSPK